MIAIAMKAPMAMPAMAPPERLDDAGIGVGLVTGAGTGPTDGVLGLLTGPVVVLLLPE